MNITKSKSMNKSKQRKMKIDTNPTKGAHGSGRFGFGFGLDLQGGRKRHPLLTEIGSDRVNSRVRQIEFRLKLKWQILAEN